MSKKLISNVSSGIASTSVTSLKTCLELDLDLYCKKADICIIKAYEKVKKIVTEQAHGDGEA